MGHQGLAVEKEVQAGALEGDVPVLQASALGAEEAAYGSFMTAVRLPNMAGTSHWPGLPWVLKGFPLETSAEAAYLTAATGAQLLALVMQVGEPPGYGHHFATWKDEVFNCSMEWSNQFSDKAKVQLAIG